MASQAEILRPTSRSSSRRGSLKSAFKGVSGLGRVFYRWAQRGQLGPDTSRELGRHLGARC
jgi:hypothetical protein